MQISGPKYAPPFPWFGGKSRAADLVWNRLGDVQNYVEPFFGSGAVLFSRPHEPKVETVNDLDCYLANFWRALQHDPEGVATWADWPVNEADLHARHNWLLDQAAFRARMHSDPNYYDVKIAGWWVWGCCQWIGSGWCDSRFYNGGEWQKLPHLGNPGRGVHRPSQKLPHLGDPGMGKPVDLYTYLRALATRLRRVRVACGDWSRVLGPTPTTRQGLTGVFLDPPYADNQRHNNVYGIDDLKIATEVQAWAIQRGCDPMMRIALCGYEGNYDMPNNWQRVKWKSRGGFGSQGDGHGRQNAKREVIWFSPHCLKVKRAEQALLFQVR